MPTGRLTTYNMPVGVPLDIEEAISLLSPFDVPLQGMSDNGGRSALSTGPVYAKKVEWQDEELLVPRSKVATTLTNVATSLVITTGDGIKFQNGDILLIDAEYLRVTAVSVNTLTVSRAYGGSAAVQHEVAADVLGLGLALSEGSDPEPARAVDRVNRFNYTQIFGPTAVHVSGSENAIRKYGITTNEFDHQVGNRLKEEAIKLEQALIYGIPFDDTTNFWRTMGGLISYITTNVDSTIGALTETRLLDLLQTVYDAGGNPDRLLSGSKQKRVISALNSDKIQLQRSDNQRGQTVDTYYSDFGLITLMMSRWVKTKDLFIFNRDQAEIGTLRPFQFEMLAKTGDSQKGQVVGEKTLKFRKQLHAARFSALT